MREREAAWDENFTTQPQVGRGARECARSAAPNNLPRRAPVQSKGQPNLSSPLARASVWLREKPAPGGRARKERPRQGKEARIHSLEAGWQGVGGGGEGRLPGAA